MIEYPTPKFILVKNYIMEKVESGVLKPGDRIPSEYELARMFNVSRVTINTAISQLHIQGVVDRIKGKGTFIKKPEPVLSKIDNSNLHSFKISSKDHTDNHQLISTEILVYTSGDPVKLMLLTGEKYHKITRLMCSEDRVIAVDYSYLPYSLFSRDMDGKLFEKHYLHTFIRDYCGKEPKRLHTVIGITFPDPVQQKYLNASRKEPLLLWNTSVIDQNDIILGYTATCARPDDFQPYLNFIL